MNEHMNAEALSELAARLAKESEQIGAPAAAFYLTFAVGHFVECGLAAARTTDQPAKRSAFVYCMQ